MDRIETLGRRAAEMGCAVLYREPMRAHTTIQIGGPADLFCTVSKLEALSRFLVAAREMEVPVLMLGNGSNLLVSDEGFRGAVVVLDGDFAKISARDNSITCGAAVSLAGLCNFAKRNSLTGMEFAWGIPGSTGGAAYMNAGAYGGEMAHVVESCRHVTPGGEVGVLAGDALCYGYRRSAYMENGCTITEVTVRLEPGDNQQIAITMEGYYNSRKVKQPLNKPSAGSIFKRPEGNYAGTLIEQCGLKGRRIGGAAVSEKHAGFIINLGGATCRDVEALISLIQETVERETGVALECEVRRIK